MPAHSNDTLTFEQLNNKQQASSISAQILSLQRAMIARERKVREEKGDEKATELHAQLVAQVERMLVRFENQNR